MTINVKEYGNPEGQILACLPGMIGGPGDFRLILEGLDEKFRILLVDINPNRRDQGLKGLSTESVNAVDYQGCSNELADYIKQNHPHKKITLIGLSIGGKIVYHFLTDYPQLFKSGVVSDITPGIMTHTDLYSTVITTVESLDLSKPWADLKEQLNTKIADRNFRVLIKSQLFYPEKNGPAKWRNGMWGLKELLERNTTDALWEALKNVEATIEQDQKLIVLKADRMSGIAEKDLNLLKSLSFIQINYVENSSHFIHINNVDVMRNAILSTLE